MILPRHEELINELIDKCRNNPDETRWWIIGVQMHTITDDYKFLYDYEAAKPELDAMWAEWVKVDPRKKNESVM